MLRSDLRLFSLKRAGAGASAVALVFLGVVASAKPPQGKTKPGPAAIDRVEDEAKRIFLQKHRRRAMAKMERALRLATTPAQTEEALQLLREFAGRFLTDKGQRTFELARSQMFDQPDQALARFEEARSLEPGNVRVPLEIARVQILKENCRAARKTMLPLETSLVYRAEIQEINIVSLICAHEGDELTAYLKKSQAFLKVGPGLLRVARSYAALSTDEPQRAWSLIQGAESGADTPPVLYFSRWLLGKRLNKNVAADAKKIVDLCGPPQRPLQRRFPTQVYVCNHQKEVQSYLKEKAEANDDDQG